MMFGAAILRRMNEMWHCRNTHVCLLKWEISLIGANASRFHRWEENRLFRGIYVHWLPFRI
jgi:hypothetical protein